MALRLVRDPRFAALLADPGEPIAGERGKDGTWWPQDPSRSVPELVTEAAKEYGLGEDAATLYLMLLAMPDPTDRNDGPLDGLEAGPAQGGPRRTGRHRPGGGGQPDPGRPVAVPARRLGRAVGARGCPLEQLEAAAVRRDGEHLAVGVIVPAEPAAELYRRAWQRVQDGDAPGFEELKVRRGRRR